MSEAGETVKIVFSALVLDSVWTSVDPALQVALAEEYSFGVYPGVPPFHERESVRPCPESRTTFLGLNVVVGVIVNISPLPPAYNVLPFTDMLIECISFVAVYIVPSVECVRAFTITMLPSFSPAYNMLPFGENATAVVFALDFVYIAFSAVSFSMFIGSTSPCVDGVP